MNAVYPYVHSNQDELRYSLRSLEMYTDCDPVLIGDKPKWYTGRHVSFGDASSHKITNVYLKLKRACFERGVSDPFLLMNDDIFLLDNPEWVHYTCGTIKGLYLEYASLSGQSYYTQCLQKTVQIFGDAVNHETHTAMLIGKDFLDLNDDWFIGNPCLFRTAYGCISKYKTKDIKRGRNYRNSEVKYYKKLKGDQFFSWIDGLPFFSTPDRVSLRDELEELYPNPSKWEKSMNN